MTQQSIVPNLYELTGQDTQITYLTITPLGQPELRYQGSIANHTVNETFRGDQIRTEHSELGTLLSVSEFKTIDQGYTGLTVVLPGINLGGKDQQALEALAILTAHAGPDSIGVVAQETYSVVQLQGTAKHVLINWDALAGAGNGGGSCNALLNDYFAWGDPQDLQHRKALIDCNVAYITRGSLVSFFSGALEFSPAEIFVDFVQIPPSFSGELARHYSNRDGSESSPAADDGGKDAGNPIDPLPFPHLPDMMGITITGGRGPVEYLSPPTVTFTLQAQNATKFSFEPQCLAGVIYGVGKSLGGRPGGVLDLEALYVISLGNQRYAPND